MAVLVTAIQSLGPRTTRGGWELDTRNKCGHDGGGCYAIHQHQPNPRARGFAYDRAAPLTEGCSMEASRSESGDAAGSWSRKPRQQGSASWPTVKILVPSELKHDA